jgi:addiction module HigA family antidote
MVMHNPMHPGEFITAVYLDEMKDRPSDREIAKRLGVAPSTFTRLLRREAGVSPEMSLRLEKGFGRSAGSWLKMQSDYDLYHARSLFDAKSVEKVIEYRANSH